MNLNSIRPWRSIDRRSSRKIMVGSVPVGGDSPITVQTMTNTLTTDINATIDQILACSEAGADIIRVFWQQQHTKGFLMLPMLQYI